MKKIIIILALLISSVVATDEVKQLNPHKVKWSADMFKYVGSKYINCDKFSDNFGEALARGYNAELDKNTAFSVFYVSVVFTGVVVFFVSFFFVSFFSVTTVFFSSTFISTFP